jgi:hypothetical protein
MSAHALPRLAAFAFGLLAAAGSAFAQSAACQRYRAELASLGRGGDEAAAQRQRGEIGRLTAYYHSLGCDRGRFLFFGSPPPAECGAIGQRLRQMQATHHQLAVDAEAAARRRQLAAAMREACHPQRVAAVEAPRSPESLYAERRRRQQELERRSRAKREADEAKAGGKAGGGRIVCVRACDGYFFPLHNLPEGRGGANALCKALCPGAPAAAYVMPGGDGEIGEAVSLSGRRPYRRLVGAFKFQTSFDPSCSCKGEGQSWAQALQRAEKMLTRHKGDLIVTAKKAEELSRPKSIRTARKGRLEKKKAPTETGPAETYAKEDAPKIDSVAASRLAAARGGGLDVETTGSVRKAAPGSRGSSGIGPKAIEVAKPIAQGEGPKVEVEREGGAKRKVRIVGPGVIAVPKVEAR